MAISSEIREDRRQKTEDRKEADRARHGFTLAKAEGGSVKHSLAMAIPKAFSPSVSLRAGFEDATQRSTSDERRATSGGFTLAEAIMAMVVLGIASAGVLLPFTSGARVQAEGIHSTIAAKLASDLMEQILNTPFEDIVEDYNDYSEPQGQVKDATGTVFTDPSYANFSRDASCAWDPDQDFFILVTVWVKYNGREIAVINRLISK